MRALVCLLLALPLLARGGERMILTRPLQFTGMADASGAVAVDSHLFLACDDEQNKLRLYRNDLPGPPLREYDLNYFLEVTGKSLEADLEAGVRIGNRAYWIGSHGRNKNAKERFNRCRFFATDIAVRGGEVDLQPVGRPYKRLLEDLLADSRFVRFGLSEASLYAPKEEDGLNIEGLAATPEGHLLIGFRNPIPSGRALIIPMLNPKEVVEGQAASLGEAIQLNLGGLGIRDMVFYGGTYLIIAGSYKADGRFELYRWSGGENKPKRIKVNHFNRYNPEALIVYPDRGLSEIQVLSDDGTRPIDGIPGKQVTDWRLKSFRSFWLVQANGIGEE